MVLIDFWEGVRLGDAGIGLSVKRWKGGELRKENADIEALGLRIFYSHI